MVNVMNNERLDRRMMIDSTTTALHLGCIGLGALEVELGLRF